MNTDKELQRAIMESLQLSRLSKISNDILQIIKKENKNDSEILFETGFNKLNDYQKDIFYECIDRKSAGLSLPLGSGKTLISIVIGLYFIMNTNKAMLIVASKSLIGNWVHEIQKFFGDKIKYEIVHKSVKGFEINKWCIKQGIHIVLITIDLLSSIYKQQQVEQLYIKEVYNHSKRHYQYFYNYPEKPFMNHTIGGGSIYSVEWGCFIVDEIQKYTNIETLMCKSLGAICSKYRWLLSGTIFDEPKMTRIFGYYIILDIKDTPREISKMQSYVESKYYDGLYKTTVSRKTNKNFIAPKVNEFVVTHKLSPEEEKVYTLMKKILIEVKEKALTAKLLKNRDEQRVFNSYKLIMIMYLRQTLTCALIPITSVSLGTSDLKHKSELSKLIIKELQKNGLNEWMNTLESPKSTRIINIIKSVNDHKNEKIIIFACFKSFLDILNHYLLELGRPIFMMSASMGIKKRHQLLEDFEKTSDGILLLSYQLGAEGLNLQFTSNIMLVDFWWNASKIQQAIGRIYRYGQQAKEINVYFFTSNTGIEKILFKKQKAKLSVLEELKYGSAKTKVPTVDLDQIIKLIELSDNTDLLKRIKYY